MIEDPRGQWAHPGKNTRIPGNQITMEGVDYPVWAVPDVGEPVLMQPGQNYTFPGASYVDEYPMLEQGGELPKAQIGINGTLEPITLDNNPTDNMDPSGSGMNMDIEGIRNNLSPFIRDYVPYKDLQNAYFWERNQEDNKEDLTYGNPNSVSKGGQLPTAKEGGEYETKELTDAEIKEYVKGGYIVEEELPKAQTGLAKLVKYFKPKPITIPKPSVTPTIRYNPKDMNYHDVHNSLRRAQNKNKLKFAVLKEKGYDGLFPSTYAKRRDGINEIESLINERTSLDENFKITHDNLTDDYVKKINERNRIRDRKEAVERMEMNKIVDSNPSPDQLEFIKKYPSYSTWLYKNDKGDLIGDYKNAFDSNIVDDAIEQQSTFVRGVKNAPNEEVAKQWLTTLGDVKAENRQLLNLGDAVYGSNATGLMESFGRGNDVGGNFGGLLKLDLGLDGLPPIEKIEGFEKAVRQASDMVSIPGYPNISIKDVAALNKHEELRNLGIKAIDSMYTPHSSERGVIDDAIIKIDKLIDLSNIGTTKPLGSGGMWGYINGEAIKADEELFHHVNNIPNLHTAWASKEAKDEWMIKWRKIHMKLSTIHDDLYNQMINAKGKLDEASIYKDHNKEEIAILTENLLEMQKELKGKLQKTILQTGVGIATGITGVGLYNAINNWEAIERRKNRERRKLKLVNNKPPTKNTNSPLPKNMLGGELSQDQDNIEGTFVNSREHGIDTPIYVDVEIRPSKIKGAGDGLFSNQSVQEGNVIGVSHIRKEFEKNGEMYQAPFPSKILGMYNHSDQEPNVTEVDNGDHISLIAIRDIQPGEELLSNYDDSDIQDTERSSDFTRKDVPKAQDGHSVKQRRGVRDNYNYKAWTPSGLQFPTSVSSHLMAAEYVDGRGWVAFPTLFQDSKPYADDQENWKEVSGENGWWPIYQEALKRGEVYDFGEDKEAALAFGRGSWKDQLPEHLQDKQEGGFQLELTPEEIDKYVKGGYVVEELPKAKLGLISLAKPLITGAGSSNKIIQGLSRGIIDKGIDISAILAPEIMKKYAKHAMGLSSGNEHYNVSKFLEDLDSKKKLLETYSGKETGFPGHQDRSLVDLYFGDDSKFKESRWLSELESKDALKKYTDYHGPLKSYELLSNFANKEPLSGKKLFGRMDVADPQIKSHRTYDEFTRWKDEIIEQAVKSKNPDGLIGAYNTLFDEFGEILPFESSFKDGYLPNFGLWGNPIEPIDDIGGHMTFVRRITPKKFDFTTRDVWGFHPKDYVDKWIEGKSEIGAQDDSYFKDLAPRLLNKFGKPFILTQTNPLHFDLKKGGQLPKAQVGTISKALKKTLPFATKFDDVVVNSHPFFKTNVLKDPLLQQEMLKRLATGIEPIQNYVGDMLYELKSPEGKKRLLKQESEHLEYIGYPKNFIDKQAELNYKARLQELEIMGDIRNSASVARNKLSDQNRLPNFFGNDGMYSKASYVHPNNIISDLWHGDDFNLKPSNIFNTNNNKKSGFDLTREKTKDLIQLGEKVLPGNIKMGIDYTFPFSIPILAHEIRGHGLQRGRQLQIDRDALKMIRPKKFMHEHQQKAYSYFRKSGKEPSAYLNELREAMLLKGLIKHRYENITPEKLQAASTFFKKNPMGVVKSNNSKSYLSNTRILDFMEESPEMYQNLSWLLNRLPTLGLGLGAAGAAGSTLEEKKLGGDLPKAKYGKWMKYLNPPNSITTSKKFLFTPPEELLRTEAAWNMMQNNNYYSLGKGAAEISGLRDFGKQLTSRYDHAKFANKVKQFDKAIDRVTYDKRLSEPAKKAKIDELEKAQMEVQKKLYNIQDEYSKFRLDYSGLPITQARGKHGDQLAGGQGRIYNNLLNDKEYIKFGKFFGDENDMQNLINAGKKFNSSYAEAAFPTEAFRVGNRFVQFMPKLDYSKGLSVDSDVIYNTVKELNDLGVGLDYMGLDNIGSVGDKLGLVDLSYIGKPGERNSVFNINPDVFLPDVTNNKLGSKELVREIREMLVPGTGVKDKNMEKWGDGRWKEGGSVELGDVVDEATMERLKAQGYTFEEI